MAPTATMKFPLDEVADRVTRSRMAVEAGLVFALAPFVNAARLIGQQVIELPAEDSLLEPDLEEVYRVGAVAGEDWETFGNVYGLAFDPVGNLYVVDTQGARIVVVNPEGGFVRQLGGVGEGPGEFGQRSTASIRIAALPDGRVAAFDHGFSVFGPDGEFVRTVPLWDGAMVFMPRLDVHRHAAGVLATEEVAIVDMSMLSDLRDDIRLEPEYRPVVRMDLTGDAVVLDTVALAWLPPGEATGFRPPLIAGALPGGGVAYTDSSAYAIRVTAADGTLERVLTRPIVPEPVTGRMRLEERERRLTILEGDPLGAIGLGSERDAMVRGMTDRLRAQTESMEFHPVVPVVRGLRTDWAGHIWVLRRGDEPVSDGPIDLLDPNGRYLGSFGADELAMPGAFGPDGLVAFVEVDELDVETVVVGRIRLPG